VQINPGSAGYLSYFWIKYNSKILKWVYTKLMRKKICSNFKFAFCNFEKSIMWELMSKCIFQSWGLSSKEVKSFVAFCNQEKGQKMAKKSKYKTEKVCHLHFHKHHEDTYKSIHLPFAIKVGQGNFFEMQPCCIIHPLLLSNHPTIKSILIFKSF